MGNTRVNRRLTTIVAADVAGYSNLTATAEEETLAALRAHRTELIDPKIEEYRGRIANTAGDSILIEFPSVVDAIRCLAEVQRAMVDRNRDIPENRRIQFRVGINIGDVVDQDGDLLGDGVNVAARLEALADPGGICISSAARDQALDRLEIEFDDLGEVAVKNIPRPIRAYRAVMQDASTVAPSSRTKLKRKAVLAAAGLFLLIVVALSALLIVRQMDVQQKFETSLNPVTAPLKEKPAIAVMPFDNLSGDPNQVYFANGITEDIITDLSKVSSLFVLARGSTAVYRERPATIEQVAKDLGVSHVLEGSVRRAGNRIRVTAQLVDATTKTQIWADRYDRELKDVFLLQDELTQKIVSALAISLTDDEQARLSQTRGAVPEAYDTLLRGLELLRRFTPSSIAEGRALFEKAIEIDPEYGRAYANVAFSYVISVFSGFSRNPSSDLQLAIRFGEQAKVLDPEVPQVHFSLGVAYWQTDQITKAQASTERALQIDPNYADAYANLAALGIYTGRREDGLKAIETAMRLNPRHPFFYLEIKGRAHFALGDYPAAASAFQKALERNPDFTVARRELASTYAQMDRIDDANWEIEEVLTVHPELSVTDERQRIIFQRGDDMDRYLEGLRKAGLPE